MFHIVRSSTTLSPSWIGSVLWVQISRPCFEPATLFRAMKRLTCPGGTPPLGIRIGRIADVPAVEPDRLTILVVPIAQPAEDSHIRLARHPVVGDPDAESLQPDTVSGMTKIVGVHAAHDHEITRASRAYRHV